MDLRRVWVIVRSGSQTAQRIANRCREQLEARGCAVICATSGLTTNPYPGLLADDRLPDLVLVLDHPRKGLCCVVAHRTSAAGLDPS